MSELFNELMQALQEVRDIRDGKTAPAETLEIPETPKAVRGKLKLSQAEFAKFVGVNEYTLKNWEQGKRKIPAPARTLFKIAAAYPEIILKVRQNDIDAAARARPIGRGKRQLEAAK